MNKLLCLNKAFNGGEILVNADYIVSVELCDSGYIHITLVTGRDYLIEDFCSEENPLMAFWKYISERE